MLLPLEILVRAVEDRRGADSWEGWAAIGVVTLALALSIALGVLRVTGSSWPGAVSTMLRRLPAILALTAVVCTGIFVGLVLLIVPGILLATWWLVAYETMFLEKRGVFDSLGRSRELVRGRFRLALGAFLLTVAAYLLPWTLAFTSESRAVDVLALTLADVVSTLVFPAITAGLYRELAEPAD